VSEELCRIGTSIDARALCSSFAIVVVVDRLTEFVMNLDFGLNE